METTELLNAEWFKPSNVNNATKQRVDKLIERLDGGRSFVPPTTKLNPRLK